MAKKNPTPAPFPAAEPEKRELHVGGVPLSSLPPQLAVAIPYANTDEGIAEEIERNKGKTARVQITREEFSKKIEQFGAQPWDAAATDPMTEVVDKVREPGYTYKMLSTRVMDRRGTRGFEVVPGAKFGNMVVGRMPIETQERRNEHYRQEGISRAEESADAYTEAQERLIRDGGVSGIAPLPTGDVLQDARFPDRAASIGHTRERE